jgi:type I site-specific restriction-modification system R (restriction) subunit
MASQESDAIIFTAVQKFSLLDDEAKYPERCARQNVVVISAQTLGESARYH